MCIIKVDPTQIYLLVQCVYTRACVLAHAIGNGNALTLRCIYVRRQRREKHALHVCVLEHAVCNAVHS